MAERIYLHVGTPKSGTSYLQSVLWTNAEELSSNGLLLPGNFQLHYTAAKGVTARRGMQHRTRDRDDIAWGRLTTEMRAWSRDALVSHELLAPATHDQAVAARSELGAAEVHLILTLRALHKQLPAGWQEQVKGGLGLPFDRYLEQVRDATGPGAWFREVQDVLDVVRRWAPDLPSERIHVVTCPTTSSDPTLLWLRFASAMGVEDGDYDLDVPLKNVSLGAVEAELLRQVHAMADYRFRDQERHLWTRRLLAARLLSRRSGDPIGLPPETRPWIEARTHVLTDGIVEAGYHLVGDLDDLRWQQPPASARLISSISDNELAEVSAWTIGRLQEALVERQPAAPYPAVGPDDGVKGILELLEHIRAADTGGLPRPAEQLQKPGPGLRSLATRLRR